jgi:hypothetical protein
MSRAGTRRMPRRSNVTGIEVYLVPDRAAIAAVPARFAPLRSGGNIGGGR